MRLSTVAVVLVGILLAGVVLSAALRPATSEAAPPPRLDVATYVGQVTEDAYVAVVTGGGFVRAYVCDGVDHGVWFSGRLDEQGRFALTARDGVATLAGTVVNGAVHGAATYDGVRRPFAAVEARGAAGLYRWEGAIHDGDVLGGWIVLNNGKQRGTLSTSSGTKTAQPITLTTLSTSISGISVTGKVVSATAVDSAYFLRSVGTTTLDFSFSGKAALVTPYGTKKAWQKFVIVTHPADVPWVLLIDADLARDGKLLDIVYPGGDPAHGLVQVGGLATVTDMGVGVKLSNATAAQVVTLLDRDKDGEITSFDPGFWLLAVYHDLNYSGHFNPSVSGEAPTPLRFVAQSIGVPTAWVIDAYGNRLATTLYQPVQGGMPQPAAAVDLRAYP
jgi:hypothetical protein